MSTIEHVIGREVLDSCGNPTVEAEVLLPPGTAVPGTVSSRHPGPGGPVSRDGTTRTEPPAHRTSPSAKRGPASGGLVSRMVQALAFWR